MRAGFGQRRKMLRRSLAGVVDPRAFEATRMTGRRPRRGTRHRRVGQAGRVDQLNQRRAGAGVSGPQPFVEDAGVSGPQPAVEDAAVSGPQLALAKLTLSLRITGVRPDGYHLLDADMVTIDLADELWFQPGDGLVVEDAVAGPGSPLSVGAGPDNLVRRALELIGRKASVRLVKRIPAGAGLGGGSADAAAVLRWAGRQGDVDRARQLGADVAFCLRGGRARVSGVGDILSAVAVRGGDPLHPPDPPVPVSTVAAYRTWDALGGPTGPGVNDLEAAALALEPSLAGWKDRLGRATGLVPTLAGSGSTWFVPGAFSRCGGRRRRAHGQARRSLSPPGRADGYLPARRCQRVAFSIFLCFFFRIRLRRFLIRDPMAACHVTRDADPQRMSAPAPSMRAGADQCGRMVSAIGSGG